jgi:CubicO group peptidase (beta-lactamase class C family)
MNYRLQVLLASCFGLIVLTAFIILSDRLFWDRYLHAYKFDTFVANPFPDIDRLKPQEKVSGTSLSRPIPVATKVERTINQHNLDAAINFAEESDSTSLIVYHNGKIQLEKYWQGGNNEQVVYSFSMHKSIVALLIGIAISEGDIESLDDPLAKYLKEWANDSRSQITIRHALQMNSGIEPMSFPDNPFSKHVRRQIGTNLTATALSFRLRDKPGTVFNYNGINPTLLVMVLERATGKRYANYLSEKLWQPLGNHDAAVWLDHEEGLARGATSLFAVPMDWLRVGQMLLNNGRAGNRQIVAEEWIEQMKMPSVTNPLYGLLTWIGTDYAEERTLKAFKGFKAVSEDPFIAGDVFYFDGLGGQRVYVVPSRKLVIVRTGVLAMNWEDTQLPNILVNGIVQSE